MFVSKPVALLSARTPFPFKLLDVALTPLPVPYAQPRKALPDPCWYMTNALPPDVVLMLVLDVPAVLACPMMMAWPAFPDDVPTSIPTRTTARAVATPA